MCSRLEIPRLETERLVLDGHGRDDLAPLHAMWSDPATVRYIGGRVSTPQESWARLLRYRGLWPVLGYGYWCVRERRSGRFVGDVGFADFARATVPSIAGTPEAGWVLAGWAHGRGLGGEAVAAALAWLDRATDHRRAVCLIDPGNAASNRVAARHGFREAGTVALDGTDIPLWARERPAPGP